MIAARLAGGNLFLPFLWWRGFWEHSEQLGALGFFGDGGFFAIAFLEHSEQLGALGFFEGWGFLGSTRSTRSSSEHSDFLRMGIFWDYF